MWAIGELTVPLDKHYPPRVYGWNNKTYSYHGADKVNGIAITHKGHDSYEVRYLQREAGSFSLDEADIENCTLTKATFTDDEKEKMELELVANPYVKFLGLIEQQEITKEKV